MKKKAKGTKIVIQGGVPLIVPEDFKPSEQKLEQPKKK